MQQQPPDTEQRLFLMEQRIAELERKVTAQEERDQALLARVDGFIDDLRRIERVQMRAFDELKAGQLEHSARLERVESRIDHIEQDMGTITRNIEVLADVAKDHKQAIERIDTNVTTILDAIRGGPSRLND
ncbi:MAG: hypothetical protein J2P37_00345 [Ktedonobacteraceae bacterium]|nr:hypothetical protein [Ktedonobacteraceae bacterium]